jgi:hypothetical protein
MLLPSKNRDGVTKRYPISLTGFFENAKSIRIAAAVLF